MAATSEVMQTAAWACVIHGQFWGSVVKFKVFAEIFFNFCLGQELGICQLFGYNLGNILNCPGEGVRGGQARVDRPPKILPDKGDNFRFLPFFKIFSNVQPPKEKF